MKAIKITKELIINPALFTFIRVDDNNSVWGRFEKDWGHSIKFADFKDRKTAELFVSKIAAGK